MAAPPGSPHPHPAAANQLSCVYLFPIAPLSLSLIFSFCLWLVVFIGGGVWVGVWGTLPLDS